MVSSKAKAVSIVFRAELTAALSALPSAQSLIRRSMAKKTTAIPAAPAAHAAHSLC
jgi:hypothetical protein